MVQILPVEMSPKVIAGVTMVDTTVLPWPGATFSVGTSADEAQVEQSYAMLADTLRVSRSDIQSVRQVHGDRVVSNPNDAAIEADAVITDEPGTIVGVKIADCLGVLIHDPEHAVVAAVHSGWRGTALAVAVRTIERMQEQWGSRPDQLDVACSPHASGARYEVGSDVYELFPMFCQPRSTQPGRWLFDNQQAVVSSLLQAGVRAERIRTSRACTIADLRFHSHRRDGERAGRCLAFIGLRKDAGQHVGNP